MAAFGALIVLVMILTIGGLFVVVAYEAIMLSTCGRTLGKMALGLTVVRRDGSPITPGQAWLRAGTRCALYLVPAYLGFIVDALFIFSDNGATLHDRVAGTVVVETARAERWAQAAR
jgi:uncharacterized RDD family membrane protein YckC